MSYYFSSLIWHAAAAGQLLIAAILACWIARGFRALLATVPGRPTRALRLSSAALGLVAFLGLVVASSYVMDRSFASHLAQLDVIDDGRAACVSACGESGPASGDAPGGLEI